MSKRKKSTTIITTIIIIIAAVIALFPIVFTFSNSFMSAKEINSRYSSAINETNEDDFISHNIHFVRVAIVPENPTTQQYENLFFKSPQYLRMFWNSVILLVPVLIGQVILAPMAAYAFENIQWKGKEAIYFMYIIVMLMPTQILLVPNFIVAGWFGIRESYLAIILPTLFHPLGVFLTRQQLKGFPKDCMEAAALDGANAWQTYSKIVRPNLNSVVAALVVLLFADNWNIVDQAVVFIKEFYRQPLSVFLGSAVSEEPGMFFAVSVFFMIPALIVFLLGQEHLTEGISLSSVKA